jgi:polar amino acid transport system substrate-binding protein
MRTPIIATLLAVLVLGAAGSAAAACDKGSLNLVSDGTLTVGTDNPAYPPWFGGGTPKGSQWKINDPATGKGFESAVAYAVAKQLGFAKSEVVWKYTPFNKSFAPGPKAFDFDINEISVTPERAKVVTFSSSYYDENQAVVVVKGTKIASVHSKAALKGFKLGAQLGTTSYTYIANTLKPSQKPSVFPTNAGAVQALKNKQIDCLVVDLPTAFYVTAAQVTNAKIVGQFENQGGTPEQFGLVLDKGSALTTCVSQAVDALRTAGTLDALQKQWLAGVAGAPTLG